MRAFFEQVSGQRDDMRSSFCSSDVIDAAAVHGWVTATSRVVGAGTGTGFVAAGLAGRAATVTGIDNSPAMLAVAARKLAALGAGNAELKQSRLAGYGYASLHAVKHRLQDLGRGLGQHRHLRRLGGSA